MAGVTTIQDRTVEIVSNHQDQFAECARSSYAIHGRGVIQVEFPDVPSGMTALGLSEMKYMTLAELRALTREMSAAAEVRLLVGMVEGYDHSREAVLYARIKGHDPISIKMKLERPTLVDGPDGVQ